MKRESGASLFIAYLLCDGREFRNYPRSCKLQVKPPASLPLSDEHSGREGCRRRSKSEDLPASKTWFRLSEERPGM